MEPPTLKRTSCLIWHTRQESTIELRVLHGTANFEANDFASLRTLMTDYFGDLAWGCCELLSLYSD
eukprot:5420323-Heterocapsa_arctica.AAC.1